MTGATASRAKNHPPAKSVAQGRCFWAGVLTGLGLICAAAPAIGENWKFGASGSISETYTNNVNYSPGSQAESDFATTLTQSLTINGNGARVKLNGQISASEIFYVNNPGNNSFAPNVSLTGSVEAIENFFFIDGQAFISQTFISPFGAQPNSLVNATANRYTQQSYMLAPYIRGFLGNTASYQVRDASSWTVSSSFGSSNTPGGTPVPNTYGNELSAVVTSLTGNPGWNLEYDRTYYNNGLSNPGILEGGQGVGTSYTTQLVRLTVPYQIDPQLSVQGRIGAESNQFPITDSRNLVYGAGGKWAPTDRTLIDGYWEHRYFGASYLAEISHRLPNVSLQASFSRNATSFPQAALQIPAGTSVSQFLNAAFTTRIPDPAARNAAVNQFLADTGLPPTLISPVNFYAQSVTVQQSETLSAVFAGTRKAVTLTVFDVKSTAVSGTGAALPPALQSGQDNTQVGAGVSYSQQLFYQTNFTSSLTYSRTTANNTEGLFANTRSNNASGTVGLSGPIGPRTSWSTSVNYSRTDFTAGQSGSTSAFNVTATISHTFF